MTLVFHFFLGPFKVRDMQVRGNVDLKNIWSASCPRLGLGLLSVGDVWILQLWFSVPMIDCEWEIEMACVFRSGLKVDFVPLIPWGLWRDGNRVEDPGRGAEKCSLRSWGGDVRDLDSVDDLGLGAVQCLLI